MFQGGQVLLNEEFDVAAGQQCAGSGSWACSAPIAIGGAGWQLADARSNFPSNNTDCAEIVSGAAHLWCNDNGANGGYLAFYKDLGSTPAHWRITTRVRVNVADTSVRPVPALIVNWGPNADPCNLFPADSPGLYGWTTGPGQSLQLTDSSGSSTATGYALSLGSWHNVELSNLPSGSELRAWPMGGTRPEAAQASSAALPQLQRVLFNGPNFKNFDYEVDFVHVVEVDASIGSEYCKANDTSASSAATMYLEGSSSVIANDLVLHATAVPDGVPGIFFYSANLHSPGLPFGHGFLCIGPGVQRLAPSNASGNQLSHALDLPTQASDITAGTTWNIQAWFRDTAAGGSGFNTSNAMTVSFGS